MALRHARGGRRDGRGEAKTSANRLRVQRQRFQCSSRRTDEGTGSTQEDSVVAESSPATLEALHSRASQSFSEGIPEMSDSAFDLLEARLHALGSNKARKYPRCSIRTRTTFSDALSDFSQLGALASVWLLLFALGIWLALANSSALGGLGFSTDANVHDSDGSAITAAVALLAGGTVSSVALRSLANLLRGSLVAVRGECPSCGNELSEFVPSSEAKSGGTNRNTMCHTCGKHLRLTIRRSPSPLRAVSGRFYVR